MLKCKQIGISYLHCSRWGWSWSQWNSDLAGQDDVLRTAKCIHFQRGCALCSLMFILIGGWAGGFLAKHLGDDKYFLQKTKDNNSNNKI